MKKKMVSLLVASAMVVSALAGCGSSSESSGSSASGTSAESQTVSEEETSGEESNVLRVGMECAYAPFNWTQETEEVANGDTAVPIYGTNFYAYGYDVMVAKKLAEQMGMELEIHNV